MYTLCYISQNKKQDRIASEKLVVRPTQEVAKCMKIYIIHSGLISGKLQSTATFGLRDARYCNFCHTNIRIFPDNSANRV